MLHAMKEHACGAPVLYLKHNRSNDEKMEQQNHDLQKKNKNTGQRQSLAN